MIAGIKEREKEKEREREREREGAGMGKEEGKKIIGKKFFIAGKRLEKLTKKKTAL